MNRDYSVSPPFPRKVMIEVSNICNHNCVFCANSFSARKKGLINDKFAVGIIKEIGKKGIDELSFHGMGEPFTNPNLNQYIKCAKDSGIKYVYIDTNCGLATRDRIDGAVAAGLDSIKVSLSAADRETFKIVQGKDDFDRVISNLEYILYIKERKPELKVYIDFVRLTLNNGQEEALREKYEKRVTAFWISDVVNQAGNMKDKIEHLMINPPGIEICEEPFKRLNITKDGFVSACCMDNDDKLVLGDLNVNSLDEIWNSDRAESIRRAMISGINLPKQCIDCDMTKVFQVTS